MGILGDVASAATGGVLGGASSARGARKKYKRDMHMYKHRHQWEVQDLKKAGLNPILSAMNGAPTAPAQAAPQQTGAADALAGLQMQVASATARKIKEETKNIKQMRKIKQPAEDISDAAHVVTQGAESALSGAKSITKSKLAPLTTQEGRASSAATLRTIWQMLKNKLEDDPNSGWYDELKNKHRKWKEEQRRKQK